MAEKCVPTLKPAFIAHFLHLDNETQIAPSKMHNEWPVLLHHPPSCSQQSGWEITDHSTVHYHIQNYTFKKWKYINVYDAFACS